MIRCGGKTRRIYRSRYGLLAQSLCILFAAIWSGNSDARTFRPLNPIVTPERLPNGATRIERFDPVDRRLVIRAVHALAKAWNTGQLDELLSQERFYNKDRLLDTVAEVAPRDAILKVQSVGGVTTLEQYNRPNRGHNRQYSIVSAIVRTQIEFQDPKQGFVRLNGRNEFILEIEQLAPKKREQSLLESVPKVLKPARSPVPTTHKGTIIGWLGRGSGLALNSPFGEFRNRHLDKSPLMEPPS